MGDTNISLRPSDHSPRATYWTERRCKDPANDNHSRAVQILSTFFNSSFRSLFVSFLYSFPIISDILAHNGMLDKDAFDIEKLRISCKINLNPFSKIKLVSKTCLLFQHRRMTMNFGIDGIF